MDISKFIFNRNTRLIRVIVLLDEPLPNAATATRLSPASTITRDASLTEKDNRIARARVIFGSRLAGPAQRREEIERQSTKIAGVLVPPRPEEPDNCCMSGCVSCVWDRYRDEMEEWAAKTTEARRRLSSNHEVDAATGAQRPAATLNTSTAPLAATSMDDDGGGSLANWEPTPPGEQTPVEDLFGGIPVGIREFMRIEKVLREKRAKQKSSAH